MTNEITAALDYLKSRGRNVGEAFMPSKGDELHVTIDNLECSYEQIRVWAILERKKDAVSGIDSDVLADLAVACSNVADNSPTDSATASQGRALHDEWTVMVQSATPPPSNLTEARAIDAKAQALAKRMMQFLITHLAQLAGH